MKSGINLSKFQRPSFLLLIALVLAVTIQLCLYVDRLFDDRFFNLNPAMEESLYLASLLMLIGVVCSRYIYHARLTRHAEAGREQLEAMISMFRGVKHKLNNDMQVVLGNAELAEILVNSGGDVSKPVNNITSAANNAVDRIEQLSVFGSTGYPNPTPIDLNAMFRESMAKLAEELPPIVTLRLELEPLSARVVADRYLLSLSLSHLIRVAVSSMRHGGEIVIRTSDCHDRGNGDPSPVVAGIYIVRALSQSVNSSNDAGSAPGIKKHCMSEDVEEFQNGLKTTKALVERSGVRSVRLTRAGDESLFAMRFDAQMLKDPVRDGSLVFAAGVLIGVA